MENVLENNDYDMVNELKARLKAGIVKFRYLKRDGSERLATGTLNTDVSHEFSDYTYKGKQHNDGMIVYWDLDKSGFRAFAKENLLEIL